MWSDFQIFCKRKTESNKMDERLLAISNAIKTLAYVKWFDSMYFYENMDQLGCQPCIEAKQLKVFNMLHADVPVRSFARSGWFIRQWLANLTHSSRIGTWMSLNLCRKREIIIHQKLYRIHAKWDKCFIWNRQWAVWDSDGMTTLSKKYHGFTV